MQEDKNIMQDQAPQAPERAFENFWYHYKWPTLIIAFFAVFFLIAIAQMGTKNDYDAHLLYTGPAYLDGEVVAEILTSVNKAADQAYDIKENPADHDSDGMINCDFNKIVYVPTMTAEEYKENDIYFFGADWDQDSAEDAFFIVEKVDFVGDLVEVLERDLLLKVRSNDLTQFVFRHA